MTDRNRKSLKSSVEVNRPWGFDGGRTREMRKRSHLTQVQLATQLCLPQSVICEYETGKSSPSLRILPRLAVALNTSTDYLLGLTENPHPTVFSDAASETELALLQAYYSLPLDKRERAVGILIGIREG